MIRSTAALILVAGLAGLTGCADAPAATAAPSFDFANAPAESGIVYRFEGQLTVFLRDSESGLQAWHGWDVAAFCQSGDGSNDLLDFQVHDNPQDVLRQLRNIHGDVQTSVWTNGPNSCARYATDTPVATGVSNFRGTDNDVSPFNRPDPKNRNAFGWMANGFLTDASGARVRYAATHRGNWDGVDPATIRTNTNIRLQ